MKKNLLKNTQNLQLDTWKEKSNVNQKTTIPYSHLVISVETRTRKNKFDDVFIVFMT